MSDIVDDESAKNDTNELLELILTEMRIQTLILSEAFESDIDEEDVNDG